MSVGEQYLTPPKAAKLLNVCDRTLRRWIAAGQCRGICGPTGRYWIAKSWVNEKRLELGMEALPNGDDK